MVGGGWWVVGGGWWVVGGVTAMIASEILVPSSNPQNLNTICLANLVNFHVAAIFSNLYIKKPKIYDFRTNGDIIKGK